MGEENTTLSVPKDFANRLRDNYRGSNDWQRLHNWAEDTYQDTEKITNEDLAELIESRDSYKNDISLDTLSQEDIKQAVRDALPSSAFR